MRRDPTECGPRRRSAVAGASFPALCLAAAILVLLVTFADGAHPRHRPRGPPSQRIKAAGPLRVPLPRGRGRAGEEGDAKSLYEDDMRIIHTGPNPLHN